MLVLPLIFLHSFEQDIESGSSDDEAVELQGFQDDNFDPAILSSVLNSTSPNYIILPSGMDSTSTNEVSHSSL